MITRDITMLAGAVSCIFALGSCNGNGTTNADVLFSSDDYIVTTDSVVQGDFVAKAISDYAIVTDYRSPKSGDVSADMSFRLSINSRDNELTAGKSHAVVIGADTVFTFGQTEAEIDSVVKKNARKLAVDTRWTLKVDMSPVLHAFASKGYYVAAGNDTIYKDDFKGVWLAGSVAPLNWDFENLYGKNHLKLSPTSDNSDIYEITLTYNPTENIIEDSRGWNNDGPVSDIPEYTSDQTLFNALYNMAAAEIASNLRPDSTYRAGKEWDGVWTRDVSYSIYLGLVFTDPYGAWRSLKAKLKDGLHGKVIIQDTGSGGSWPVSSDRIVWAMAAWEVYKATGDKTMLSEAFDAVSNTLRDDMLVVWSPQFGLMHGEQSYLDWREQTYPKWMQPIDIYESMCLGTNVMFAQAFRVYNYMAAELGEQVDPSLASVEDLIIDAVNNRLWIDNLGYYSEYLYGGVYPLQSQTVDNLGQALSIIFDVADMERACSVIANTPYSPFGITSVYPQQHDIQSYHNNAVWPFVQAYWNIASAKVGNMAALEKGLASMMRAAAMYATHKELFVADNGDYRGTAVNSDAQLWSCTGFASMVYRVIMGMSYETDGIHFAPYVPKYFGGVKVLGGLRYRDANVTIRVKGYGDAIAKFEINGVQSDRFILASDAKGDITVDITMNNAARKKSKINNQPQAWMPRTPIVDWICDSCGTVLNRTDNVCYDTYINSMAIDQVCDNKVGTIMSPTYSVLNIVPVEDNRLVGFSCRPHPIYRNEALTCIDASDFGVKTGTKLIKNKSIASKYVETSPELNDNLAVKVCVPHDGEYYVDVVYSNGSGPINTQNKCAIRILYVNDIQVGAVVMPQRGIDEWISTGLSNMLPIKLKSGENRLCLKAEMPNMNDKNINVALIKRIRLIKK